MNRSVIVRVIWWLWNQMFQYAFIKALALKKGVDFKLDITSFDYYFRPFELENFNIKKSYIKPFYSKRKLKWILKRICYYIFRVWMHFMWYYKEKKVEYEFLMDFKNKRYFEWYFISPKFFEWYRDIIIKDFSYIEISDENKNFIQKNIKGRNTISVHIRRWDYLNSNNSFLGTLWATDYYDRAIKYMKKNFHNPIFLFFSDDIEWVKKHFKWNNWYIYINLNNWKDSWQDMVLMSQCRHNIIANSTFSWWWAYLNENPDKIVICPKNYRNDNAFVNENIYPEWWLKF